MTSRTAVVALGSNLGDRRAALAFAIERLSSILTDIAVSDIVETVPEGEGLEQDPLFLNAVVAGTTTLGARELFDSLQTIEQDFGRGRPYRGAPRTLDLDLILLGDEVVDEPDLHVPHARFRDRFFVLGPLAGIAPELRDPVTGLRVAQLLKLLLRDSSR